MAVYNNYVDANLVATPPKIGNAALISGVPEYVAVQSFVIDAADSAASIYRIFKGIPSDAIITSLDVLNEAVAGVTAGVIGLYNVKDFDGVGAAINSGTELCAGFNFSSANTIASASATCLTAPTIANREKQLWELASQTQAPIGGVAIASQTGPKAPAYDIGVKMVGMTTNTAALMFKLKYIRGV